MKCIICNKDKEPREFSKEHVIPESAGSSYFIDTVCKDCNNLLGRTIDKKFLDNFYVKIFLSKFDIKNKKGKLPKLWTKLPARKNSKIKGIPQYNQFNNQFNGWKFNNALINLDGSTHLVFDSNEDIEDVLREFEDDELPKEVIREKFYKGDYLDEPQELVLNKEVSLDELFFEAIKIAYEFASSILNEDYFNDSFAIEFQEILLNSSEYALEDIKKYFFNFNFGDSIFDDTIHSIFLIRVENSVVVSINLFNCFVFSVEVSKNLNLIPKNLFANFLLINLDGTSSEYNIMYDDLESLELIDRLKKNKF